MTDFFARIVEVNGANVNQENHKQVVTRIKSIENETTLLGKFLSSNQIYSKFQKHFAYLERFRPCDSHVFFSQIINE